MAYLVREAGRFTSPRAMIQQTKGKFFTVQFVKRTTGEVRKMNCRIGVSKGVTGTGKTYDPEEKGLVTVWDTQAKNFRSINLDGIISITSQGVEWHYGINTTTK